MARMYTTGFEGNHLGTNSLEGLSTGGSGGTASIQGTTVRTGSYAGKTAQTSGSVRSAYLQFSVDSPNEVYIRFWFRMGERAAGREILSLVNGGNRLTLRLDANEEWTVDETDGFDTAVLLATATAFTTTNTWIDIRLHVRLSAQSDGVVELKIGASTWTEQQLSMSYLADTIQTIRLGNYETKDADMTAYYDDLAVNNTSGSDENGYPHVDGRVALLVAWGENAGQIGDWTGGAGGTADLYEAVNNIPPAGASSETDTTNIKNAASSTTSNVVFHCEGPGDRGLRDNFDTIKLVQAVVRHGEHAATSSKSGAVKLADNPVQSSEDTFTYGDDSGAHGAEIGGWRTKYGTPEYNPTVLAAQSIQVMVGKRTATTETVCVDFVGVVMEYVFGTGDPPEPLIYSDDFNRRPLKADWTFVNPVGDCSYQINGVGTGTAELQINVPGGAVAHDDYDVLGAARIQQACGSGDFTVELKITTDWGTGDQKYKECGLRLIQGPTFWIRFDGLANSTASPYNLRVYCCVKTTTGKPTVKFDVALSGKPNPLWLKMARSGTSFTLSYSTDGTNWTTPTGGTFTQSISPVGIAVAAGNQLSSGTAPAVTALFDYFFDTAEPISPEDDARPFEPRRHRWLRGPHLRL